MRGRWAAAQRGVQRRRQELMGPGQKRVQPRKIHLGHTSSLPRPLSRLAIERMKGSGARKPCLYRCWWWRGSRAPPALLRFAVAEQGPEGPCFRGAEAEARTGETAPRVPADRIAARRGTPATPPSCSGVDNRSLMRGDWGEDRGCGGGVG